MAAIGGFGLSAIRGERGAGGGEAAAGAVDETQQSSSSNPLGSLTLNIQLKFVVPDKKAYAHPKPIDMTIDSHSWSIASILVRVREQDVYRNKIIEIFGENTDSDMLVSLEALLLCGGQQLYDDTDARKRGSFKKMLEQARRASAESTGVCALVAKISKREPVQKTSTPKPQSSACDEEGDFLNHLESQRWSLLKDFDRPDFEATSLYRCAFKLENRDIIEKCIKGLSRLGGLKNECVETKKKLIKTELDTQQDAFDIGRVRPLDAKLFPGVSWTPAAQPASSDHCQSEQDKRERQSIWPWDLRLHHKLHHMLMFDIAELEMDEQSYTGKAQLPKRDKKAEKIAHSSSTPLKSMFAEALSRNSPGTRTIDRGQAVQILSRCGKLASSENVDALATYFSEICADPNAFIDETAFLELAQKLQKKLTSIRASLTQAISESKGLCCVDAHLQHALQALEAFEGLRNAPVEEDCWYTKKSPPHHLEKLLQCWRSAKNVKKIMPLSLSTLCKKAFADKSTVNKSKGFRAITLKQVKEIVDIFAHGANQGEIDALNKQIADDPTAADAAIISEEGFLDIVEKLQLTAGVKDVVQFYDKLIQIENLRRESGRPPKLEFSKLSDKDNRSLDLHRILGVGFDCQIQVTCCPMEESLRQDYSKKIELIHKRIEENDAQLSVILSAMKVHSSFLFVLVRARMHQTLKDLNSELAATSSLGICGIKTFKNFITESFWEAEREAYLQLGLTTEKMEKIFSLKSHSVKTKKDENLLQIRFRQLLLDSFPKQEGNYGKLLKLLRDPLRRLKKFPKPSVEEPSLDVSASDGETFSVATVTTPSPHTARVFL
jgi:hypothetical protein